MGTCRGNDLVIPATIMAGIASVSVDSGLKWKSRKFWLCNRLSSVVATGTPAGEMMGTPTNGKSFK